MTGNKIGKNLEKNSNPHAELKIHNIINEVSATLLKV